MCGRYRLSRRKQIIEEHFDAMSDDDWTPRYNIAPTQPVPVIRQNSKKSSTRIVVDALGFDPVVGERFIWLSHDD